MARTFPWIVTYGSDVPSACGVLKSRTQTRRKRRCRIVKRKKWVPYSEKRKEKGLSLLRKIICVYESKEK